MKLKTKRLKEFVLPSIFSIFIIGGILTTIIMQKNLAEPTFNDDTDFRYSTKSIITNRINSGDIPTISTNTVIMKPFNNETVKLFKSYYDYKDEAKNQENAIIFYENTYMQNSGITYNSDEKFEIISILDGTVTKVAEDDILGRYIEIRHTNDMISTYQSLEEITVNENDEVKQGQVIAKSGKNNLNKDIENCLHFELLYKGEFVNPLNYFDKKVQDL